MGSIVSRMAGGVCPEACDVRSAVATSTTARFVCGGNMELSGDALPSARVGGAGGEADRARRMPPRTVHLTSSLKLASVGAAGGVADGQCLRQRGGELHAVRRAPAGDRVVTRPGAIAADVGR